MKKEPKFTWDEVTGVATCYLNDGKNIFFGSASCADADADMKSQKTGCQIALWRAEIKYYVHLRDNEIKPALRALRHAYASMVESSKFNPNSYESKALRREIHRKEFDLYVVKTMLTDKKQQLKSYLAEKETFYKHVRAHRKENTSE